MTPLYRLGAWSHSANLLASGRTPAINHAMDRIAPEMPVAAKGPVIHLPVKPAGLAADFTATADLHVLAHGDVPTVAAEGWRMEICGLVERAMTFSLDDLLALPQRELVAIHQCAGNPLDPTVPARQIANVVWGGVDLRDVLDAVGVAPEASLLWAWGLDGGDFVGRSFVHYVKDIPLERVREGEVLIAHRLNGEPLTESNGYPARLVVPGYYGTNSVKWLCRLELADRRPEGLFTTQLYNDPLPGGGTRPVRHIAPESMIHSPAPDARLASGSHTIRGRAWGNARIVAVDVSCDGGQCWQPAEVTARHQRGWHSFALEWQPPGPGEYVLQCRATDETGEIQPAGGARNAIYSVSVTVG
jgi:DMSO/TMAO reductase YedYZ molybdopterin-dependent catalytic subunit